MTGENKHIDRFVSLILKIIANFIYVPFWHLLRVFPRNPNLWVFGAWFGEKYTDNAKILFEYITVHDKTIDAIWITRSKSVHKKLNEQNIKCYMNNSLRGKLVCLRAKFYIFSSAKYDINPLLMNGANSIQLWHGSTLKKVGLDSFKKKNKLKNFILKYITPFKWEFNYDAVVSSSQFYADFLSTAFNMKKSQIIISGYPRNDVLFSDKKSKYLESLVKKYKSPKVFLYLPTFRDKDPEMDFFIKFGFDLKEWSQYLNDSNSILVIKPHFAAKINTNNIKSDRILLYNEKSEPDINLFMKDVDLLITDYSGVYFDFKLTSKPIVLAPFDLEEYISFSRELYIDYSTLIEPKGNNWNEILMILKQKQYLEFSDNKSKFNDHYDGNSSERLLESIKKRFLN